MKKLILILMVVAILVSACGKEEVSKKTAVAGPSVNEIELPAGQIPGKAPTAVLPSLVKILVDKAGSVTSLDYSHNEFDKGGAGYYMHAYVKGDKMKQVFTAKSGEFAAGTYYDTVYLDLAAKTVEAYCEDERCTDRNAKVASMYADFVTETPFTVLANLKSGTDKGTVMFDNRETRMYEYEDNGVVVDVYIWTYKGIPLKYERYKDGELTKKVEYMNLLINTVKDSDLVHQQLQNLK